MKISISTTVNAPIETVWNAWTAPEHITSWNFASDEWQCPTATNDLRVGGTFSSRMEAKDGSMGFDFEGTYTQVDRHKLIAYKLADDRIVRIEFHTDGNSTKVTEHFDTEDTHTAEQQRDGWQAILDNFKSYTESL
ncbi:MAG: SRPBCC family protein [Balneolaceae bacterium]|nr:SRPBCC family protein [Balneolaceae bacterium]